MNVKGAVLCASKAKYTHSLNKVNHSFIENNARIHKTSQLQYPRAKTIPLPTNVEAIITNEIGRFSPQRTRDLNGPVMMSQTVTRAMPVFQIQRTSTAFDPRVPSFDCVSAVNLNSSMQTNVPFPFSSKGKSTHLNMPGGQWESKNKFISEDLQKLHYINITKKKEGTRMVHTSVSGVCHARSLSTDKKDANESKSSMKEKLKKAVTEYGSTVIVFHVGISLISLGTCYILVSSGVDVGQFLPMGLGGNTTTASKLATGTGTFVVAYAVHKMFAPVRISITLGATPFIVRYLRNIGFLKKP